jgi:multiple sugar transport system substrate-binding protein
MWRSCGRPRATRPRACWRISTPIIEAAGYDLEDYWPGLLESAKFEGSVYGFPRDIEVNVIYYNKDMFDAAGVAYPSDDWTWDDFLARPRR